MRWRGLGIVGETRRVVMSTITEDEIRAFVGPNADYYHTKWEKTGFEAFSWAACLLGEFWCPFRKMYIITVIYWGILFLTEILGKFGFWPDTLSYLFMFCSAVIFGFYGNRWYRHHTYNEIAQAQSQSLKKKEHIELLTKRGGTSLISVILFLASYMLVKWIILPLFSSTPQ